MSSPSTFASRRARFLNRLYARFAARQNKVIGFVSQPEPRTIGSYTRGRQLMAGNLLFGGYLIETNGSDLWGQKAPGAAFDADRHGFAWLDDLAAVGDPTARSRAQDWVWGWISAYDEGRGPGWTPELTGRRMIRWINHALFLLRGQDQADSNAFFKAMARQSWFLSKRWSSASPGLPRFEALTGLIYASLALEGQDELADPAVRALARECDSQIDGQGGLPTRNPEDLLEVFTLLTWAAAVLHESGRGTTQSHTAAIQRIAPTLRTLRHADGGLARFHGGGRGLEGRLDHALAASLVKPQHPEGLAMGFARLSARRTTVIVDAAPPPMGVASPKAHASTLAFEMTTGRRPLIVNCGSGASFGPQWKRAGRATPSHSTVSLGGYSSARLTEPTRYQSQEYLVDGPLRVPVEMSERPDGMSFEGGHDGYVRHFGLTHARSLELTFDGGGLAGEDLLLAMDSPAKRVFDQAMDRARLAGIAFDVRFHLHPDVNATLDLGGAAVSMVLKSGEVWVFRHNSPCKLSLDPGVFLETGRIKPRSSHQIVLSGRAMDYATRIRWSLSKPQKTGSAIRDLERDDLVLDD